MKKNPANQLFYTSQVFKAAEHQRSSFAFSSYYIITDEHGAWTRDLDLIYELYIEKYKFINAVDKALYDYSKSLANRRQRLSLVELRDYFGEREESLTKRFDRLQDCLLGHRVYRSDLQGIGTFDFVIHSPFTRRQLESGYADMIYQRIENKITRESRRANLPTINYTDKNGKIIEKLHFNRDCIPSKLQLDFRELRQLYHTGLTKEETENKISRRFWKEDKKSNTFFAVCLDTLRELKNKGITPIFNPDATEQRTANWKEFKSILKRFCELEWIDIQLTEGRYKAAWKHGNYYAPNMFIYVPI